MRKDWAGHVERLLVGRSFSSDVVERAWVHVAAQPADLQTSGFAVIFVGPALQAVDKRTTICS
jgi:hypothetical protein